MELTIPDIIKVFSVTRSSAYRLVKKKGWDYSFRVFPTGGRETVYNVPESEIPESGLTLILAEENQSEQTVIEPLMSKEELSQELKISNTADIEVTESSESIEILPALLPEKVYSEEYQKRAQLKAELCEDILSRLDKTKAGKNKLWKELTETYNSGQYMPELFRYEKKRSERTLRNWVKQYQENDCNHEVLIRIPRSNSCKFITDTEKNYLLSLLLDTNRIKIGSAIRKLKQLARLNLIESNSNERSLRRWCEEWKEQHLDQWNLLRQGNKYLKDCGMLSILRANSLSVGDVWVADGHTLAFDIIDPKTGKAKRMTLILFFDWASRYPVGASIANTEDSEHIMLALRNGIMNWGAKPRFVYLDNGRAFKSKLFHEQWKEHDLEKELCGIFPRLGIEAEFAQAYNARAKVVERFFKTFQEDFERFMDTFRGGSIADKPAHLMRNEKWIRDLKERKPLELDQAKQLMAFYFQELYGKTPHYGLDNKTPLDVFKTAEIPEDRKVEPSRLNFLMLKIQNRVVGKEGIRMSNAWFWHEKLVSLIGREVTLRYDMMDMRSILVYDGKDNLICQAIMRTTTHPFIKASADVELAEKELHKQLKAQRKLEKDIKTKSAILKKQVDQAVADITIPLIDQKQSAFNNTPLLTQETSTSANPELDQLMDTVEKVKPAVKPKDEDKSVFANFDNFMKTIGID